MPPAEVLSGTWPLRSRDSLAFARSFLSTEGLRPSDSLTRSLAATCLLWKCSQARGRCGRVTRSLFARSFLSTEGLRPSDSLTRSLTATCLLRKCSQVRGRCARVTRSLSLARSYQLRDFVPQTP